VPLPVEPGAFAINERAAMSRTVAGFRAETPPPPRPSVSSRIVGQISFPAGGAVIENNNQLHLGLGQQSSNKVAAENRRRPQQKLS